MNDNTNLAIQICEGFLIKDKAYNVEHKIWKSIIETTDKLLNRTYEMTPVYKELVDSLSQEDVELFLDLLLGVATFGSPEAGNEYRKQKKRLVDINKKIANLANQLADLLDKRDEMNNHSGFSSRTHYHIVDVIDNASLLNGHYCGYLKKPLHNLSGQFDLKYWPALSDIVKEIGDDADKADITPNNSWTNAVTASQRSSTADFFRALFNDIDDSALPSSFRLSDNSLSVLANCALDLSVENMIDSTAVKSLRQRLRKTA